MFSDLSLSLKWQGITSWVDKWLESGLGSFSSGKKPQKLRLNHTNASIFGVIGQLAQRESLNVAFRVMRIALTQCHLVATDAAVKRVCQLVLVLSRP